MPADYIGPIDYRRRQTTPSIGARVTPMNVLRIAYSVATLDHRETRRVEETTVYPTDGDLSTMHHIGSHSFQIGTAFGIYHVDHKYGMRQYCKN